MELCVGTLILRAPGIRIMASRQRIVSHCREVTR